MISPAAWHGPRRCPAGHPGKVAAGRDGPHGDGRAQPARGAAAARTRHARGDRIGTGPVEPPRPGRAAARHRLARPQHARLARGLAVDARRIASRIPCAGRPTVRCRAAPARWWPARTSGVVSIIMSTRLPFTTSDYLHDTRFPHEPGLDDTFRDEGIAVAGGRAAAVGRRGDRPALRRRSLPPHAHRARACRSSARWPRTPRVAIKNANAFEQANAALAHAEAARAELERHARNVQAAAEAHEQMTSLLAKGASLATLCQSIAQLLEGSVLVLDEAAQVISRGTSADYAGQQAQPLCAARRAQRRRAAGAAPQPPGGTIDRRLRGRRRGVPRDGGDRRRRRARLDPAVPPRATLDDMAVRTFERSASVDRHRAAVAGAAGGQPQPRRIHTAALADLAAPGRRRAAVRTAPSASASTSRSRSR